MTQRHARLIVVRRGDSEIFASILNAGDRWPAGTALMVDRRERERRVLLQQRVTLERRKRQRRGEPHPMWYSYGFMVVETVRLPVQAILLDTTAG